MDADDEKLQRAYGLLLRLSDKEFALQDQQSSLAPTRCSQAVEAFRLIFQSSQQALPFLDSLIASASQQKRILREKAKTSSKEAAATRRAILILSWILEEKFESVVRYITEDVLSGTNNKMKLKYVNALYVCVGLSCRTDGRNIKSHIALLQFCLGLLPHVALLLNIASASPTVLAVQVVDYVCMVTGALSFVSSQPGAEAQDFRWNRKLWVYAEIIIKVLMVLERWQHTQGHFLAEEATKIIHTSIENLLTEDADLLTFMWYSYTQLLIEDGSDDPRELVRHSKRAVLALEAHSQSSLNRVLPEVICIGLIVGKLDDAQLVMLHQTLLPMGVNFVDALSVVLTLPSGPPQLEASRPLAAHILQRVIFANGIDPESVQLLTELIPAILNESVLIASSLAARNAFVSMWTDFTLRQPEKLFPIMTTLFESNDEGRQHALTLISHLASELVSLTTKNVISNMNTYSFEASGRIDDKQQGTDKSSQCKRLLLMFSEWICLHADDDMLTKCRARDIFAAVDLDWLICFLCSSLLSQTSVSSVRIFSSLSEAFLHLLSNHSQPLQVLLAVITFMSSMTKATQKSSKENDSADHVEQQLADGKKEDTLSLDQKNSMIFTVLDRWAVKQTFMPSSSSLSSSPCCCLLDLIDEMFKQPENPSFVALLAHWSQQNYFSNSVCFMIISHVIHKAREFPVLTEKRLNEESSEYIKKLLFLRLSPLLVLKLLPLSVFQVVEQSESVSVFDDGEKNKKVRNYNNTDENEEANCDANKMILSQLSDLLLWMADGVDNSLEFLQVRQLAAELFARLPLEHVLSCTLRSLRHLIITNNVISAQLMVYVLCHCFAIHRGEMDEYFESDSPPDALQAAEIKARRLRLVKGAVPVLCSLLFAVLSLPSPRADTEVMKELEKLQRGAMECLSSVLATFSRYFYHPQHRNKHTWNLMDVLLTYLAPSVSPPSCPSFASFSFVPLACLPSTDLNHILPLDPPLSSSEAFVPASLMFCVCMANVIIGSVKRHTPTELALLSEACTSSLVQTVKSHSVASIRAATVQILFTTQFARGAATGSPIEQLVSVAIAALQDDEQVQLAGLKLLGGLLAQNGADVLAQPRLLVDVPRLLLELSQSQLPNIRSLARELSRAIGLIG